MYVDIAVREINFVTNSAFRDYLYTQIVLSEITTYTFIAGRIFLLYGQNVHFKSQILKAHIATKSQYYIKLYISVNVW